VSTRARIPSKRYTRSSVDSQTVVLVLNNRVLNRHAIGGNIETIRVGTCRLSSGTAIRRTSSSIVDVDGIDDQVASTNGNAASWRVDELDVGEMSTHVDTQHWVGLLDASVDTLTILQKLSVVEASGLG